MGKFFDDLGKAVQNVTGNISAEFSVAAQEQRLREAYQELGRKYFEAVQAGTSTDAGEFATQLARIHELQASIEEIRRNQNVSDK
ncbi:MAG: hypothetical protein IJW14_03885 [Oscillospiraceae bacterium]|nr:hypothetical protein [Oscillospiraceae bacterium]